MEERYIRIRWQGNNSSRYDDTIQDVPFKHISKDDLPSLVVGGIVHVQMGRAKRKWTGIVVDMLNDEDIAEQLVSSNSDDEESDNEALSPPPKKKKASKASGKAGGKANGKAGGKANGKAGGKASGKAGGKANGKAGGKASGKAGGKASGKGKRHV